MSRIIVRIFIAIMIAQVFHQFGRRIADMQRHRQITRLLHCSNGIIDTQIRTVALRTGSEIHHRFGKCNPCLRPAYLHHRIKGSIRQQERIRIRQPHILACTDHHSPGDELRIFAALYHTRHPVECRIRVTASNTLDEGRDDVIMHLALLIISQRILLQLFLYHLISDNHFIAACRFHHQFQDIEQFPGITATEAEHGCGFLQLNLLLLEFHILGDGSLQEPLQVFLFQRFEHIELATGKERTDYLERGIFRCSTNQGDNALLHRPQQRVLLALGEAMNLINKQDRRSRIEESATLRSLYHLAHILYATGNGRKGVERDLQGLGYDLSQSSLAHSRRSPENKRGYAPCVYHLAQHGTLAYQMLLSDIIGERARSHSFS